MTLPDEPSPSADQTGEPVDPFDPARFRVASPDAALSIETITTAVPVRRPTKMDFFRVHSDPSFMLDTYLLEHEDGGDRETYLVELSLCDALSAAWLLGTNRVR